MKLGWYFGGIEFNKKTFVLTMNFYCDGDVYISDLSGSVTTTYDRGNNTYKHRIEENRNETKIVGKKLENVVLDSFNENTMTKKCMLDLEIFNGKLQKELEQGKFEIHDWFGEYVIKLKNLDFELEIELDHAHNIKELTLNYEYSRNDLLTLLDKKTYMEMTEKIHQKLRLRELFNKEEE